MSLTSQQEAFARGVAEGKSQAEAYRAAYPKSRGWKAKTVWKRASEMMARGEVSGRVDAIRAELAERSLWSREESVEALKGVIAHPDKGSDVVAAVRELNAMHGFNAPEQVEVNHRNLPRRIALVAPGSTDEESDEPS